MDLIQHSEDIEILDMIKKNDSKGWEALYDKYSNSVFGIICQITRDKKLAEEIIINYFSEIPKNPGPLLAGQNLHISIILQTFIFTITELKMKNIKIVPANISSLPGALKILLKENRAEVAA